MLTLTGKIVAVVIALLLVAIGVLTWRLNRAAAKERAALAAIQGKTLVDSGWLETETAHTRELERLVPDLERELDAVKKSKATLAGTSHWEGRGAAVAVPCTVTMGPPPAGNMSPTSAPETPGSSPVGAPPQLSGNPGEVAVTPNVRIDDAVALDDAGGIFVARKVQARLSVGQSWASEWGDVAADPGSTTKVAPELVKAWAAWKNPPPRVAVLPRGIKHWRMGWSCGVGVGYGVVAGGGDVVGACIWGAQF